MTTLLLVIIYLAFVSLGLPDSLLGSAWPVMHVDLGASVSAAGNISMIIAACTIVSSLMADKLIHKFGTAWVTAVSVAMTAVALFGFSTCTAYWQLLLWAVPYGLGAGSVDSALNNYVALHFKARHMSWLHAMWGIGASIGPYIMGLCMTRGAGWAGGYRTISILQFALTAIVVCSIPLWKQGSAQADEESRNVLSIRQALALPGAKMLMVAFFCYCSLESSTGLWASSWLNEVRDIDATTAASYASLFYIGITAGRLASGFISEKLGDDKMIRLGQGIALFGTILLMLPAGGTFSIAGLVMVGLGCAPIYPCIIHSTPARFGAENSQSLVGIEMASAYVGSTFAPKIFGVLSDLTGLKIYPFYLIFFVALMFVMTESCRKKTAGRKPSAT